MISIDSYHIWICASGLLISIISNISLYAYISLDQYIAIYYEIYSNAYIYRYGSPMMSPKLKGCAWHRMPRAACRVPVCGVMSAYMSEPAYDMNSVCSWLWMQHLSIAHVRLGVIPHVIRAFGPALGAYSRCRPMDACRAPA